jgi:Xaa-Pro dipeptidase
MGFRESILASGMGYVECGLHGHGLASPEFPSCMYGGQRGSWQDHAYARIPDIEFKENMVFATATDLFDPAWNADTGLMMGRTIRITKHGPKEMTGIPIHDDLIVAYPP